MKIKEKIKGFLKENPNQTYAVSELTEKLQLNQPKAFKMIVKTIAELEDEGVIRFTSDGKIGLNHVKITIKGIFHAHANGFGFVTIDPEEADVFIAKEETHHAMDGDEVEIELLKNANPFKGQNAQARIERVTHHHVEQIVGTFFSFGKKERHRMQAIGYVKARNKKISVQTLITDDGLIPNDQSIVRVKLTHYPNEEAPKTMCGRVIEIIGSDTDRGIDVLEILASMEIHANFPQAVLNQAKKIPEEVSDDQAASRVDYRNEITFTIDGADAKDLDDAVHAKRLDNGNFELGVHIADVSYYVTEGSALDREAYERGTSVYVTDRVVPMLPERLSNGICSLNPHVNRLTQSCVMEITPNGQVIHYQISPSIIKTTAKMTYDQVNQMISGDLSALTAFESIADSVSIMTELHHILEKMRQKRGAINFDTVEAKISVDEKGIPTAIKKRTRGVAERMIESFMLIANETVASDFEKRKLPFLYRIHEQPKADKLQRFIDFASTFGEKFSGSANQVTQKSLQSFLSNVKGKPGEMVLSTLLLRSMQQARYSEQNFGHFGLAAQTYTHFTSPIRRYPDLIVHRLLRVMDHPTPQTLESWEEILPEIAKHTSNRERRAVNAEREVEKMKKAEYMTGQIGEIFEGIIASVTRFGIFVALENTIEGLIHISTFKGDVLTYHERSMSLISEHTNKSFKIGQAIKIKVISADKMTGEIDFEYLPSALDPIERATRKKHSKDKEKYDTKSSDHKKKNTHEKFNSDHKKKKKSFDTLDKKNDHSKFKSGKKKAHQKLKTKKNRS
ncbi:ribonuclease R [Lactococcus hircilactis]|uniref:Ribonuclease R n=1 Tax=Lactococcus hircilactis TaxID=1494462 RepID=A0A7X1Z740_9LACT|nr:ribonuclease R [Lactococcus hircilactis]MQW38924.1 ribonuclease R [Lactococcus hircilactis]